MNLINFFNDQIFKHWKEYFFLIFIYCLFRIPTSFFIVKYSDIVSTLQVIYAGFGLFQNLFINPEIVNSIVTPSNLAFIFTPGVFYLTNILNNFTNIIIFSHLANLIFVILFYNLVRKTSSKQLSLIFSLIIIYISIKVQFFGPDYLVQPIMAGALLLFFNKKDVSNTRLVLVGFLCGLIFIFKQNFGIFFLVVIGTGIFFKCLNNEKKLNFFSNFIILIYYLFGIFFLLKTNFVFNYIYFLFPYFLFWTFIVYLTNTSLNLDNNKYIRKSIFLLLGFIIIPIFTTISLGNVIGYEKYLFSIFGMGWEYLPFWEYSIIEMISSLNFRNNNEIFFSLTIIFSVFLPFLTNLLTTFKIFYLKKNINEFKEHLTVGSIGIISIFLLFPFEDFRIPTTKIFIFLFVFAYFFSYIKFYLRFYLLTSLIVLFIFLQSYYNLSKFFYVNKKSDFITNINFQKIVNLKIETKLLNELNSINKFITDTTKNNYFYLVSQDLKLIPFLMLNKKENIQHYQRQDYMFMNNELADAIIEDLKNTPYILSTKEEYDKFTGGKKNFQNNEKYFFKMFKYIDQNFEYYSDFKTKESKSKLPNLVVLKKK